MQCKNCNTEITEAGCKYTKSKEYAKWLEDIKALVNEVTKNKEEIA